MDEIDQREVVYLLHGVDSELQSDQPRWYGTVLDVFAPFYRVVPLRYTDYDRGGKVAAATSRGGMYAAVAATVAIGLCWQLGFLNTYSVGGAVVALTGGVALSAREFMRRHATVRRIVVQASPTYATVPFRQHVIAHSFGTFLLPEVMATGQMRLHHLILVGSALPTMYPWEELWNASGSGNKPFACIRNEHSAKDLVIGIAGVTGALTGCGSAGRHGFKEAAKRRWLQWRPSTPAGAVRYHRVPNAFTPCNSAGPLCSTGPVVHNVDLTPLDHSDYFLSPAHAKALWLPVLWDSSPPEYREFRDLCTKIVERRDDDALLTELAGRVLQRAWSWFGTPGKPGTLREYVDTRLKLLAPRLTKGEAWHRQDVCVTMAELFIAAWQTGGGPARLYLNPVRAVATALQRTLRYDQRG